MLSTMPPPVLAVVDIGSNSIKSLVASHGAGGAGVRALFQETLETRISGGIGQEHSRLGEPGMAAGLAAVRKLLADAEKFSPTHRLIVATSAVRDAANRDDFAARIRAETGSELEILSGGDEARLIALGIGTDEALGGAKHFTILDLGGGSLECIRFERGEIAQAVSLQLGAVRLTEKFMSDPRGPFTAAARSAVAAESRRLLAESGFHFAPGGVVVGTGGAFAVARAVLGARRGLDDSARWPAELSRADLAALLDELAPLTMEQRSMIPRLPPERADIMPAALATIVTLLEAAGAERAIHSWNNLRFGVAARFFAQLREQR